MGKRRWWCVHSRPFYSAKMTHHVCRRPGTEREPWREGALGWLVWQSFCILAVSGGFAVLLSAQARAGADFILGYSWSLLRIYMQAQGNEVRWKHGVAHWVGGAWTKDATGRGAPFVTASPKDGWLAR